MYEHGVKIFGKMVYENLRNKVLLVTVFGSFIDGRATGISDIDIGVLPYEKELDKRLDLVVDIMDLASRAFNVPEDRVDILFLDNDLPIELMYKSIVKGIVVYCSNLSYYRELRLKILSEYLDFQVFRRKLSLFDRYLKAVEERTQHG